MDNAIVWLVVEKPDSRIEYVDKLIDEKVAEQTLVNDGAGSFDNRI